MKRLKKLLILLLAIMACTSMSALADVKEIDEERTTSFLTSEKTATDIVTRNARGEILSEGAIQITNKEDGTIYIMISTAAHRVVDRIHHAVFLDQWDEDSQDWTQVDYFDFEMTKEEDSSLSILMNSFLLEGYPTNKYYRVRGLHMVELGDEMEGCATETDGVLITDH